MRFLQEDWSAFKHVLYVSQTKQILHINALVGRVLRKNKTAKSLLLKVIKYILSINERLSLFYSFSSTSSLGEWVQAKVDWRERKKETKRNYKQSYPVFKSIYYMEWIWPSENRLREEFR